MPSSNGARICSGTWAIPSKSISIRVASWSIPTSCERDYAIFFYGMDGADRLLEAYPHDFVLIGAHTKGCDVVRRDARWHLLYSDQTAALFARAELPGKEPVIGNVAGIDGKRRTPIFPDTLTVLRPDRRGAGG